MLKIEFLKSNYIDIFKTNSFVRILIIIFLEFFLSILIDPYIEIFSPVQNILVNAIIPTLFALLIYFLIQRIAITLLITNMLHIFLVLMNLKKTEILNSNIIYYDFLLVHQYLEGLHLVLGFIGSFFLVIFICFGIFLALILTALKFEQPSLLAFKYRISLVIITLLVSYYSHKYIGINTAVELPFFNWSAFNQVQGAYSVGVTGNIQLGYLVSGHDLKTAIQKNIDLFWNDPLLVSEDPTTFELVDKPDVIVLQSESLIDPGDIKDLHKKFSLNFIRSAISKDKQGYLLPPVWGGYTLQTEFEVLTGVSTNFFGSRASYYDLPLDTVLSIPKIYNSNQYKTIALHPNDRKYWNREIAFKKLGFSEFKDLDYYWQWKDDPNFKNTHNLISDFTLMKSIIQELEQSKTPTLLFAISLGNHGPWGMFGDSVSHSLNLEDSHKKVLSDYLHTTKEVDDSFKILLNYLKTRKKPTLLVFYSDHLPGFGDLYDSIHFKNNRKPTSQGVPIFVWSNYNLTYSLPEYLPSYLLGGWILTASGISPEKQFVGSSKLCNTMQKEKESYETIEGKYKEIWENYKHLSGYYLTHSK
jgi:phosphoglycerol transferase MdoB-like AlkP superfamily enzyme